MKTWPRTLPLIALLMGVFPPATSGQVIQTASDPAAQTRRAQALIAGDGVRQDVTAGLHLLRRAAEKAHPPALRVLGDVFAAGTLVGKDDAFAVALYRAAADRGDAEAQWQLADRFARGWGVAQDEDSAAQWRLRAAAGGHPAARRWLALLLGSWLLF